MIPCLYVGGEQPVKLTDTGDVLPVAWVGAQRIVFASHGKTLHLQQLSAIDKKVDEPRGTVKQSWSV